MLFATAFMSIISFVSKLFDYQKFTNRNGLTETHFNY